MRIAEKHQVEQLVKAIEKSHSEIKKFIKLGDFTQATELLSQCQDAALAIDSLIASAEGEGSPAAKIFEGYGELVSQLCKELSTGEPGSDAIPQINPLRKEISKAAKRFRNEVRLTKEVVFLPYKASMWDSLESVWQEADADPDCNAYVIPIPYFDKNPDGSLGEEHYEGDLYPSYVPILHYDEYNFEKRCPDVIFIHNPYDEHNYVTSVHPYFYARRLKQFTNELVYIPYFVLPEIDPGNEKAIENMKHFCFFPGTAFADKVILQSENMKKIYVSEYMKAAKEHGVGGKHINKAYLEQKFLGLGSPKFDKMLTYQNICLKIPQEWERKLKGKHVLFFNTNLSLILRNDEYFVENVHRIFEIFDGFREIFSVIWREHPLTMATLRSMRPQLLEDYLGLREYFQNQSWGILDETTDFHLAMAISDCYFGAGGSLSAVYAITGKPMMITAYGYPAEISHAEISKEDFLHSFVGGLYYKEKQSNALRIFLENYEELASLNELKRRAAAKHLCNIDGEVGKKIHRYMRGELKNELCDNPSGR